MDLPCDGQRHVPANRITFPGAEIRTRLGGNTAMASELVMRWSLNFSLRLFFSRTPFRGITKALPRPDESVSHEKR